MTNIKIYTLSTCPHCKTLKEFLKTNNIEFKNIEVDNDKKAQQEMIKKSKGEEVPVIDIDGEIIIGFEEEKLKEKLKIL